MTPDKLQSLLSMISARIQRSDTHLRGAIQARVKLEATFNFFSDRKQRRNSTAFFLLSKAVSLTVVARSLRCDLRYTEAVYQDRVPPVLCMRMDQALILKQNLELNISHETYV